MAVFSGLESHSQALLLALLAVGFLGRGYAARPGDGTDENSETPAAAGASVAAADLGGSSFLQEADILRGFGGGDDIYDSMQEKSAHLEEALARTRDQVRRVKTAVRHDELVISDLKEKISEAQTLVKATNAEEAELRRGRAHAQLEMFATMARASASSKDILSGDEGEQEDSHQDAREAPPLMPAEHHLEEDLDRSEAKQDAAEIGDQAAKDYEAKRESGDLASNQVAEPDSGAGVPTLAGSEPENDNDQVISGDIEAASQAGDTSVVDTASLMEHELQQTKNGGVHQSTPKEAMALDGKSALEEMATSKGTQRKSKAEHKHASHGKSADEQKGTKKKHHKAKHGSKKHHRSKHHSSKALETESLH